jgi:hypothetical protein
MLYSKTKTAKKEYTPKGCSTEMKISARVAHLSKLPAQKLTKHEHTHVLRQSAFFSSNKLILFAHDNRLDDINTMKEFHSVCNMFI